MSSQPRGQVPGPPMDRHVATEPAVRSPLQTKLLLRARASVGSWSFQNFQQGESLGQTGHHAAAAKYE